MKLTKVAAMGATVALSALALAACSSKNTTANNDNTLRLMLTGDVQSLDNSNVANLAQWNVLEQTMEGLYRADKKGNPAPAMATKVVKPSNNGKTYVFHLRKNAKWANGDPVTAQDFVNSWRRSAGPTAKSGYNYIFTGIKNAEQVSTGKMPTSALGVKALDRHTLRVDLEYAMPYFSRMMVLPAFFPQNTRMVKQAGSKYGTNSKNMVANGPFQVKGWTGSNDSWKLVRNKYYYDKKDIHLKQMNMRVVKDANTAHQLFQQKQLDDAQITGTTAQGLQKDKNLRHVYRAGTYYLRLNLADNKAFQNAKLRQALFLVLNKDSLAKKVLSDGSQAASTYVAPRLAVDPTTGKDFAKETAPKETYNVKKAQQLWQEGLKELGQKKVKLTLVSDDQTVTKNVGQFVQSQVESKLAGASVEVHAVPSKEVSDRLANGNFDMQSALWLADFADPVSDFDVLTKNNPQNYGKYANDNYNQQLVDAKGVNGTNPKKYWANMRAAQEQLNQDMPVVPLYTMTESHLVNPKVKGVLWHSVGETDYTRASFTK